MGKPAAAIICLGNRYVAGDDVGCRVFECLKNMPRQDEVELIDGGLCGLDLLSLLEGRARVVFADALTGVTDPDRVVVLGRTEVAAQANRYGHSAGLPFLLGMMPRVVPPPWPAVAVVGAAAGADERTVLAVAERCMGIASRGDA